jgi:hypothetical protein
VDKDDPREPYVPPEILRVKLVSEEMAVVGCKTLTGAGAGSNCRRTMCKNIGS